MDELEPDDDRLLSELAAVVGPDPLPGDLTAICRELSTWAEVDAELVELLDVGAAAGAASGVRSSATAETSVREFHLDDGRLVIEVIPTEAGVTGTIMPAPAGEVVVESSTGARSTGALDGLGRFSVSLPERGVVRLRLDTTDGPLVTDWFAI